jgi:tetratricopeptide (TPR) repeat protein
MSPVPSPIRRPLARSAELRPPPAPLSAPPPPAGTTRQAPTRPPSAAIPADLPELPDAPRTPDLDELLGPEAAVGRADRLALWAAGFAAVSLLTTAVAAVVIFGQLSRLERRLDAPIPALAAGPPPGDRSDPGAAALREQIAAQDRRIEDLLRRLDAAERRPATPAPEPKPIAKTPAREPKAVVVPPVRKADPTPVRKTEPDPVPAVKRPEPVPVPPEAEPPAARRLAEALGPGPEWDAVRDITLVREAYRPLVVAEAKGDRLPPATLLAMARAGLLLNRPAEALAFAAKAAPALPEGSADRRTARRLEAIAAFRAGRFDLADPAAERTLLDDPAWAEGRRIRIRSLTASGKAEPAERAAREWVRSGAEPAAAQTELGAVLLARADAARAGGDATAAGGFDDQARAAFEAARAADPRSPDAAAGLALALVRLGRPADAVDPLKVAVAGREESAALHFLFGSVLAATGADPDVADTVLSRAADLAARSGGDDLTAAVPGWPTAPGSDLRAAAAHLARGRIMLRAGKPEAAEERFRRAYMTRGDTAAAYVGAAEAMLAQQRPADALADLDEALRLDPPPARAYLLRAAALAEAAAKAGRPADLRAVADALRRAVELDPALRAEIATLAALKPLPTDKWLADPPAPR